MTTLAATLGAVAARLRPESVAKWQAPYWSQPPSDDFATWAHGFAHGAFVAEPVGDGLLKKPTIPEQVALSQQEAISAARVAASRANTKPKKAPVPIGYAHPVDWKLTAPARGANPGGIFTDPTGRQHYVKFYANPDQGKNEVLANAIYRTLGISAPESRNVIIDGKKGVESPMINDAKPPTLGAADLKTNPHVKAGFLADAFLANHDVAGAAYDNMLVDALGNAHRIDNGGSMFYRASGKLKGDGSFPFVSNDVPEIDSMRDPAKAKQAGTLFADVSDAEMLAQAKTLVRKLTDDKIAALVAQAGFAGDAAAKYVATLIGRRNALALRFLSAAEEAQTLTTAELANLGLTAPDPQPAVVEPVAPALTPAQAHAFDPEHPHPDLLALDPSLKNHAISMIVHLVNEGNSVKAVTLAKTPKLLAEIFATKYQTEPVATILAEIARIASNGPTTVARDVDGSFSVHSYAARTVSA